MTKGCVITLTQVHISVTLTLAICLWVDSIEWYIIKIQHGSHNLWPRHGFGYVCTVTMTSEIWPWVKVMTHPWFMDNKFISPRSRSQCTYTGNLCPGHNSSLPSWIWIIFHTLIVYDRRVCHNIDPRSYLWGQGHSAHIPKNLCLGHNSLIAILDLDNISHNCCPWTKGVSWPWPKVISLRSLSQCTHTQNRGGAISYDCHVGSW